MYSSRPTPRLAALASSLMAALFAAGTAAAEANTLVSVPVSSPQGSPSGDLAWDRNGRYGVFTSTADNLVIGQDINANRQVFLYDRITRTVRLVSHVPGIATTGGNGEIGLSAEANISADGKWVLYASKATDLVSGQVDGNDGPDVFLWSRENDSTTLVSHRADSATTTGELFSRVPPNQSAISDDGRFVVFSSSATDLVAGQTTNNAEQVYLYDRTTGTHVLVSHAAGSLLQSGGGASTYFTASGGRVISSNGRWVVFVSLAADLVTGVVDGNGSFDLYLWDRQADLASSLRLLSRRAGAPLTTVTGSIGEFYVAADGSAVVFTTGAANVEGVTSDTNGVVDVFRYDRLADAVALASRASQGATVAANGAASSPSISGDGRRVAFHSLATNHVPQQEDENGESDVFLWQGAIPQLVSHVPASLRETGNGPSVEPLMAEDGGGIAFTSSASDLAEEVADSNNLDDVFFRLRGSSLVSLLSHVPSGAASADRNSRPSSVALGGALVAFNSAATDLVPGPINNPATNVYFHGSLVMADGFESGDLSAWSQHFP